MSYKDLVVTPEMVLNRLDGHSGDCMCDSVLDDHIQDFCRLCNQLKCWEYNVCALTGIRAPWAVTVETLYGKEAY
jgi:hypothetical protein